MNKAELAERRENLIREFQNDSIVVGEQTARFLKLVYPAYLQDQMNIESLIDTGSAERLQSMTFFRISSCTADNVDKVFESVSESFQKLFRLF